jgi:hypothetical protein
MAAMTAAEPFSSQDLKESVQYNWTVFKCLRHAMRHAAIGASVASPPNL